MKIGKKKPQYGVPVVFVLARRHHGAAAYCVCGSELSRERPLALRVHVYDGRLRGLCDQCAVTYDPALARLAGVQAEGGTAAPREFVEAGQYVLYPVVSAQTRVIDAPQYSIISAES